MKIYRVKEVSCDGGHIGRTWKEYFYKTGSEAVLAMAALIKESDEKNPKHPYNKEPEIIDTECGFCNWQFGNIIIHDTITVN